GALAVAVSVGGATFAIALAVAGTRAFARDRSRTFTRTAGIAGSGTLGTGFDRAATGAFARTAAAQLAARAGRWSSAGIEAGVALGGALDHGVEAGATHGRNVVDDQRGGGVGGEYRVDGHARVGTRSSGVLGAGGAQVSCDGVASVEHGALNLGGGCA